MTVRQYKRFCECSVCFKICLCLSTVYLTRYNLHGEDYCSTIYGNYPRSIQVHNSYTCENIRGTKEGRLTANNKTDEKYNTIQPYHI